MQVNGKLRGVVKVPPTITDAELEKIALADANVQAHIAGKTVQESRRSSRVDWCRSSYEAGQQANRPTGQQAVRSSGRQQARGAAGAADPGRRPWRGVVRLCAGGPRLVPARLHQDPRHPDVRQCHAVSERRAAVHAEGARSSFRAAAATRSCPATKASTASCAARSSRLSLQPVGVNDAQLASRYRVTVVVKVRFEDVKAAEDAVGEPGVVVLGRIRAGQPQQPARTCRRSSATSASRWIACPPTSRARSSARSSKRSDVGSDISSSMSPCRNPQADQERQDRAALPARRRRSAVAPRPRDRVRERRRRGAAGVQRPELLRATKPTNAAGRDQLIGSLLSNARTLPMMAPRRVIVVHEADRLLAPKRAKDEEDGERRSRRRKGSALRPRRPRSSRPTSKSRSR